MSKRIKRAIVAAVAVAGLATGTMGAVAAGTVYHHTAKHAVADSGTFYHG
jgi:hypothetical protein